jgi:hypothetical protein
MILKGCEPLISRQDTPHCTIFLALSPAPAPYPRERFSSLTPRVGGPITHIGYRALFPWPSVSRYDARLGRESIATLGGAAAWPKRHLLIWLISG